MTIIPAPAPPVGPKGRRRSGHLAVHLVLLGSCAAILLPYYLMVLTSVKPLHEVFTDPFTWIPSRLAWENYREAWTHAPFARYFVNTLFIAIMETTGVLVTSALAGYAFARMRFWGRELVFTLFLGTLMVPGEVQLVPNYITITRLGWLNTYYALIVPWLASVFGIFFMRQFFATIPQELQDAATIDGASHLTFLRRVVVPLARLALVSGLVFGFVRAMTAVSQVIFLVSPSHNLVTALILSWVEYGTIGRGAALSAVLVMTLVLVIAALYLWTARLEPEREVGTA